MDLIKNIISKEPFKTKLYGFDLVTTSNFNTIKNGSTIQYITLDEELKFAGTLIKQEFNGAWKKSYLLIMSGRPWKLKFQSNWIFYKEHFSLRKVLLMIANDELDLKQFTETNTINLNQLKK